MTLRGRLLLAYGYLVTLTLVVSGLAIFGFVGLSEGIEVVLDENFRSIDASMEMLEALERQDSITLAALLDDPERASELAALEERFENALREAEENVTEPSEPPILEAVRTEYAAYRKRRDSLIAESPERPLGAYEREVFPRFAHVKSQVRRLLEINRGAMVDADQTARERAVQSGAGLAFLVTIALISFILLSRALHNWVLSRLGALQDDLAAVGGGDLDRRLQEVGNDELASIARSFNELLDRLSAQRARSRGRLSVERQLSLGLLNEIGPDAAIYSLTGDRMAGDRLDSDRQGALTAWIRSEGKSRVESPASAPPTETLTLDGENLELQLLTAPPSRPVAWLVRRR